MKQCLKCLFYSKEFDEVMKNDDVENGNNDTDFHACRMFDDISQDIIGDKKQCEYFVDKNKV